jgi:hypothetical protein
VHELADFNSYGRTVGSTNARTDWVADSGAYCSAKCSPYGISNSPDSQSFCKSNCCPFCRTYCTADH